MTFLLKSMKKDHPTHDVQLYNRPQWKARRLLDAMEAAQQKQSLGPKMSH